MSLRKSHLADLDPFLKLAAVPEKGALHFRMDEDKRTEALRAFRAGELNELEITIIATTERERPRPLPFSERAKATANFTRFALDGFEEFAKSFEGQPFLRDHSASSADKGGVIISSEADKKRTTHLIRQTVRLLKPWAIESALVGTMERFSIGWRPLERGIAGLIASAMCTVCDGPMFGRESDCTHWPGDVVKLGDTGRRYIVELEWRQVAGKETSDVVFPAAGGTGIESALSALAQLAEDQELRTKKRKKGMDPKLLAELGLKPDASPEDIAAAIVALKGRAESKSAELQEEIARREAAEADRDRHAQRASAANDTRVADIRQRAMERGLFTEDSARAKYFDTVAKRSVDEAEQLLGTWKSDPEVPVGGDNMQSSRSEGRIEGVRGGDSRDKWVDGATQWMIIKSGQRAVYEKWLEKEGKTERLDPGEFRGLSLTDLARGSLKRSGTEYTGLDKLDVIGKSFTERSGGYAATGDFPVALENLMHKLLLASYGITPDTWSLFCAIGSVSDFRAHNRYRVGNFGGLDDVPEGAEYKNKPITDAEKETISAATKGNIIALTRQAVINDDIGVFASLATRFGRAAALTVEKLAYTRLAENSDLGPTMNDGNPLFHASHNNIGVGAALSGAALDADSEVMESQADPGEAEEILDLKPTVLLVPRSLRSLANSINDSQYDIDDISGSNTNNKFMKPNTVQGMFSRIIATTRLSGTRRYLFADPTMSPALEMAFLDGRREPYTETQDGWRVDGAQWKVRIDVGCAGVDYRTAVTNAGA